jgi:hypothetical protein
MSPRPVSVVRGIVTLTLLAASGMALASVSRPATEAAAASATLRVVTANLAFRGPDAVRKDWDTIGPEADIVFVQEAKNVRLRDILGDGWAVRQDTSSEDKQGSAVVVRKSMAKSVGDLVLVKGTDASSCGAPGEGIMTRWIARVDVQLNNDRWIRASALHMPPPRCQNGPGSPYAVMADNVVAFVKRGGPLPILGADWNKVVDDDPNEIGARTGMKPRGPDSGLRIDGFYIASAMSSANLRFLPQTGSDHRPVAMNVQVPAP